MIIVNSLTPLNNNNSRETYEIYTSNDNNATASAKIFQECLSNAVNHLDKVRLKFASLKS